MPADQRKQLSRSQEVKLDPALLAEFAGLRDSAPGQRGRAFTGPEDELLLMFWPHKSKDDMARKIGCHETTLRARYRQLVESDPERARTLAEEGRKLCSR